VNNYNPPFSKLKTFAHKTSATLSAKRQLVIMLHRDPNASGSTPGLKAYTSSWSMRSQVNRTAHDVILYAPITGTPPLFSAACNRCREGLKRRGSEPSGKKELYFFMRANLLFSRSEVERSELKNSTVYKLSVIGFGNTATVYVQ